MDNRLSAITWFASAFPQLNGQSKKLRASWLARRTSTPMDVLTARSSTAVTNASLIWQSNCRIHHFRQLCPERYGMKSTIDSPNSFDNTTPHLSSLIRGD